MRVLTTSIFPLLLLLEGSVAWSEVGTSESIRLAMTHLELTADLDYEHGSLRGLARMTIENISDEPAEKVPLILNRLMSFTEAQDGRRRALDFEQDVSSFLDEPKKQVTHALVTLQRPLQPGQTTTLDLHYTGYLVGYTETGSIYIRDRIDPEFSILRVDAHAFPSIGVLSWRANRLAPRVDFSFEARITVPEAYTVASGGTLLERSVEDGRATFTYRSTAPVPFLNLPIADYEVIEKGGLRLFVFSSDRAGARVILDRVNEAIALLTRWLGPLGQEPSFAIMEIPSGWGSQAHIAAGIMQTAEVFEDPTDLRQLYHELSHLWNAPDLDQPPARWNEGLAMYLQCLLAEEIEEWTERPDYLESRADRLLRAFDSDAEAQDVPFAEFGHQGLTDYSYATGLLFFSVLEEMLGRDELLEILRAHFQKHRQEGTTFGDLEAALRGGASRDLDRFLQEWVHTTKWQDRVRERESIPALAALY